MGRSQCYVSAADYERYWAQRRNPADAISSADLEDHTDEDLEPDDDEFGDDDDDVDDDGEFEG